MKKIIERVVVKNDIAVKKLLLIVELDAIKSISYESEEFEMPVSQEYKTKNKISKDIEEVRHISIKWMDGETTNIVAIQDSIFDIETLAFFSFKNAVDIEIKQSEDLENMENSDDEEYEYEDEEGEEEEQPLLPFPTSIA